MVYFRKRKIRKDIEVLERKREELLVLKNSISKKIELFKYQLVERKKVNPGDKAETKFDDAISKSVEKELDNYSIAIKKLGNMRDELNKQEQLISSRLKSLETKKEVVDSGKAASQLRVELKIDLKLIGEVDQILAELEHESVDYSVFSDLSDKESAFL